MAGLTICLYRVFVFDDDNRACCEGWPLSLLCSDAVNKVF